MGYSYCVLHYFYIFINIYLKYAKKILSPQNSDPHPHLGTIGIMTRQCNLSFKLDVIERSTINNSTNIRDKFLGHPRNKLF